MNPEYRDIELIEKYLEGKLTSEELLDFEKRIQQDVIFAEQVKAQMISNSIIEDYELLKLKKQMQLEVPRIVSGRSNNNFLFFGVCIVVMSGIAGYFIFNNQDSSTPNILHEWNSASPLNEKANTTSEPKKMDGVVSLQKKENNTIHFYKDTIQTSEVVVQDIENIENTEKNQVNPTTDKSTSTTVVLGDSLLKINKCSGLVIENSIEVMNSCENKNNGSIKISVIEGGISPYSYKIKEKGMFSSSETFKYLSSGDYYLSIKEGSGCIYEIKEPVTVGIKDCQEPFSMTFTPSQEASWKLPIESGMSGKMTFKNKAGNTVYELTIHNGQPSEWNGLNNGGEEVPSGYYYVVIEMLNGSMIYGYLTINR